MMLAKWLSLGGRDFVTITMTMLKNTSIQDFPNMLQVFRVRKIPPFLYNGSLLDVKNQVAYGPGILKRISPCIFAYRIIIIEFA